VTIRLLQGDCRAVLASLPAESVHCVVTSPPYYGLRDYGTDGQLGLEPTPQAYIANMVEVFREVRRVLRKDGTLWLNISSSYNGSGKGPTGHNGIGDQAKRQGFVGGSDKPANPSRQPRRVPAYGTDGTTPRDSSDLDSSYLDLCGECSRALSSRTESNNQQHQPSPSVGDSIDRDTAPLDSALTTAGGELLSAQASTIPESLRLLPGECSHCDNCGVCLSVLRSSSRDARACVRRSAYSRDIAGSSLSSVGRTLGTEPLGLAQLYSTITSLNWKAKDMLPIPWLLALALVADGWYLRSDIIWSKPNPMPESVTDRPTKAHEYLFLLSKSRTYYYDADAIREEPTGRTDPMRFWRKDDPVSAAMEGLRNDGMRVSSLDALVGRNKRSVWESGYNDTQWTGAFGSCLRCGKLKIAGYGSVPMTGQDTEGSQAHIEPDRENSERTESLTNSSSDPSLTASQLTIFAETRDVVIPSTSNQSPQKKTSNEHRSGLGTSPVASMVTSSPLQTLISALADTGNAVCVCESEPDATGQPSTSVWRIATEAFPEAHFATYPTALVEPCIKAGTSEKGCCPACGAPWVRVVERGESDYKRMQREQGIDWRDMRTAAQSEGKGLDSNRAHIGGTRDANGKAFSYTAATKVEHGWRASCLHPGEPQPCTVLDPFAGAGTTLLVADRLQRNAIGCELSAEYVELARRRLQGDSPMFTTIELL